MLLLSITFSELIPPLNAIYVLKPYLILPKLSVSPYFTSIGEYMSIDNPFNLGLMSEPVIAIAVSFSNFKEQPVIVNSINASDESFPITLLAISAEN